jgi:hypothetical protein
MSCPHCRSGCSRRAKQGQNRFKQTQNASPNLPKQRVASSSLVSRSRFKTRGFRASETTRSDALSSFRSDGQVPSSQRLPKG